MYTVLSSRRVFDGRAFSLRVDEVQMPDGRQASWEILG
ncbi:MAG: ADP-ribose pyrophosphatase, partial [Chloroflexi bacterium]|nr:ADP-ribose pyrophosphatase [Chloroflexota bacterium]